jgi:hypothetical protein
MFGGPEHESYIGLMKALRLEHEFHFGDWYYGISQDIYTNRPGELGMVALNQNPRPGPSDPNYFVWLPRLDQWLTLLTEARHPRITFDPRPWPSGHGLVTWETWAEKPGQCWVVMSDRLASPECPTREEACARLWLKVYA